MMAEGAQECAAETAQEKVKRYLLIGAGTVFLVIGAIGIIVPLLPTTPFLLLAAACYLRGSKKFYNWLINHPIFGRYIKDYLSGAGIPLRSKVIAIALLWITIGFSAIYFVEHIALRIVLAIIAVGVTTHLLMIPTRRRSAKESQAPES